MQVDKTTENFTDLNKKINITIKGKHLKNQQFFHALAINLIPLVGTIAAVTIGLRSGIGLLEIGLLISSYSLTLIGITVGFHRLFSHSAFQPHPVSKIMLAIFGSMACQGPLIYWVSNHRRHHQFSDKLGDPHSPFYIQTEIINPIRRLWHSHIGWTFTHDITNTFLFAKDLIKDPVISKISQLYYVWVLIGLFIPTVIGGILTGTSMGLLTGFLWGGCVRLFLSYHFVNGINSIAHLYGSRTFDTRDQSTNNIWLAIPTFGEAWHNNHHAFPNSAKLGLKWWQVDLGYWTILILKILGLAWDLKTPTPEMIEARKSMIAKPY